MLCYTVKLLITFIIIVITIIIVLLLLLLLQSQFLLYLILCKWKWHIQKIYQHPRIFKCRSYIMIFANTDSHLLTVFDISNLSQCPIHQSGYLHFNVYQCARGCQPQT